MIGRRMANIIKRFARHRDDMRVENFQCMRGLYAEWKLLCCPTEYRLPNLTPLRANRNLGANCSNVVSGGILKREVNVAVCFHFCGHLPAFSCASWWQSSHTLSFWTARAFPF